MGLDYGSKTVGIALSDALCVIASPYETIKREKEGKLRPTLRRIVELCQKEQVGAIVLGYPMNMDDSIGERAEKTREFKRLLELRLEQQGLMIPVKLWDERLSTVSAMEILRESGIPAEHSKEYVDKVAASLILEDYMKNGDHKNG